VPSLDRNSADALVAEIVALRRDLSELQRLRRRPSPGAALTNAGLQTFTGGTTTKVTLGTALYGSPGMADTANSRIIIPSAGIYLVSWRIGRVCANPLVGFSNVYDAYVRTAAGPTTLTGTALRWEGTEGVIAETAHSVPVQLEADDALELMLVNNGGGIPADDYGPIGQMRLYVDRLHDVPALS